MARRRQEIEAFVRHLFVEFEAAEAAGMTAPQAIADHFNGKGAASVISCSRSTLDKPVLSRTMKHPVRVSSVASWAARPSPTL